MANRLAERRGLTTFRVEIENGQPSYLLGIGTFTEECRGLIQAFAEREAEERQLGYPSD